MRGFDATKDVTNVRTHGISLARFDDMEEPLLWSRDDAHSSEEERWHGLGLIDGTLHAAVVTFREAQIRVISLRRASRRERVKYVEAT